MYIKLNPIFNVLTPKALAAKTPTVKGVTFPAKNECKEMVRCRINKLFT